MSLAPGMKLGPYEILALIGAGGMGEVYRARDSRLKRDVAIKILPRTFSSDADRLRRFEQEALATAALNHPNILAVFDIGSGDGAPYVVSELLEGETLRERLQGGPIQVRKALDYAVQVVRGLAAAHEKGIIHRDLKPENIFVTNDGRVKILDFGLAKLTESASNPQQSLATVSQGTEAGVVLGTVGYMSPEQVRGKQLDPRSDIFSFGAILYEMLSGTRAFHGETPADTMSLILKEEPAELSATNRNVSPALERIVHHCLEKSPEARFHSARDIAFDLEHLSGISTSSARLASAESPISDRRLPMLLAAASVVAVVALGLGWWLGHSSANSSPPQYKQITFRKGNLGNARFAPDGSVVYGALWDGAGQQLYVARADDPGARELGIKDADLLSISHTGELAVRLRTVYPNGRTRLGTLSRVPMNGGTPREVLDNVMDADWSPDGENMAVARFIPENGHWHLEYPIGKVLLDSINWISDTRISPDNKWIAFADHENNIGDDEGAIAVIAADGTGQEKKLSIGWESVAGIAWSGDEIWFSATLSGFAIQPRAVTLAGKVRDITNAPGGLWVQDLHAGIMLAVTNQEGRGIRALAPGAKSERDLGWFDWSILSAFSRDGREVLFYDVGDAGGPDYTVFLRDIDGSPPSVLGQGRGLAISPDDKWVITQPGKGGPLKLVPTGAGEARTLTHDSINYGAAQFLPSGKQLLASGIEPGHGVRDYLIDVATGNSKPATPEGTEGVALSPDGKLVALRGADGKWSAWALDGSGARPIPGLDSNSVVTGWSSDGSAVYVGSTRLEKSAAVDRVNIATGNREHWKTFGAEADFSFVEPAFISADGTSYAYLYGRTASQAYLVKGLK